MSTLVHYNERHYVYDTHDLIRSINQVNYTFSNSVFISVNTVENEHNTVEKSGEIVTERYLFIFLL